MISTSTLLFAAVGLALGYGAMWMLFMDDWEKDE